MSTSDNIKAGDPAIINRCLCKINKVGKRKLYFDEYDSYPVKGIWIYKMKYIIQQKHGKSIVRVYQYLTHQICLNIHLKSKIINLLVLCINYNMELYN